MRVHVVSDVHGRVDALARAGDGADALICLGDLLLFVDYADHGGGVLGEIFGAEAVARFVSLRSQRRYAEVREFTRSLWARLDDRDAVIAAAVRAQYDKLFAALPTPTYLTYGNVDVPTAWAHYAREGLHVHDGTVAELDGWRFGFVGGGLPTPQRSPFEVPEEEYAAKVAALGSVDVLCSHIPPAVPELAYDVVARRFERGSTALLEAIRATQPRYALFGHVHQPLQQRMRIGRTECVNVGHFRGTGRPWVLTWER